MSPQPPQHHDESPRPVPLLPMTGLDSASAFDLPYATDELSTLPPPPSAASASPPPPPPPMAPPAEPVQPVEQGAHVEPGEAAPQGRAPADAVAPEPVAARARRPLPSTFATPAPPAGNPLPAGHALPPSPSPSRSGSPAMPAPLAAGPLSGEAFDDDDAYERIAAIAADPAFADPPTAAALPPMVAKGPAPVAPARPAIARTPQAPPAPSIGDSAAAAGPVPSHGSIPWSATAPLTTPTPPAPSTPALTFSPDAELPGPPPALAPRGGTDPSAGPAGGPPPPVFVTAQPFTATIDPRRSGSQIVSNTRLADGILVAAAAAVVAGFAWWAVVAFTERQFVYLAVLLGVLVGQAALVGGRRGSIGLGIVAGALTLLSLTATQYFITRSLAVAELPGDIPLWDGASRAVEIIRDTFEEDPATGIFVIIAAVVAGVQAGIPGKRASGPLGEIRAPREPSRVL